MLSTKRQGSTMRLACRAGFVFEHVVHIEHGGSIICCLVTTGTVTKTSSCFTLRRVPDIVLVAWEPLSSDTILKGEITTIASFFGSEVFSAVFLVLVATWA
jgi:hypothetical protein